jgi:hypothetical protein
MIWHNEGLQALRISPSKHCQYTTGAIRSHDLICGYGSSGTVLSKTLNSIPSNAKKKKNERKKKSLTDDSGPLLKYPPELLCQ